MPARWCGFVGCPLVHRLTRCVGCGRWFCYRHVGRYVQVPGLVYPKCICASCEGSAGHGVAPLNESQVHGAG